MLYVAATRAKQHLYLTYPRELMTPDRKFKRVGMSPFLVEISPGTYERLEHSYGNSDSFISQKPSRRPPPSPSSKKRKKVPIEHFSKGSRVDHPFFGAGTVQKLTPPRSLDISFDRHGVKTLHLDYAKLSILES